MRKFVWIAAVVAVIAGCSSNPAQEQAPAGVEDRTPTTARPGEPAPQTQPSDRRPPSGVDLTARPTQPSGMSPLKDPANILSKRSIYYDFDRFDVRDEFKPLVEAHARYLREHPTAKVLIQGNTDERGGREYNIALGQRRAEGVKRMLMLLGAKEDQLEAVSLGEEKPKAQGSTEDAWTQNRRSDLLYQGEY